MDFPELRKEYETQGFDESQLADDPIQQLSAWYDEAVKHSPGKWFEPNAMALATADLSGRVSVRWVLLKGITDEGIRFFTNYESLKGKQLKENPQASVALHWPYLGRQLRIEGEAHKTSREVSLEYFHSRPRGSQIGALASKQSEVVASRDELDREATALTENLEGQDVPLPDGWGGYLLRPNRFEFWQGRLDRLHDRMVYDLQDGRWIKQRLAP